MPDIVSAGLLAAQAITSAGGYLRVLTQKARTGQFSRRADAEGAAQDAGGAPLARADRQTQTITRSTAPPSRACFGLVVIAGGPAAASGAALHGLGQRDAAPRGLGEIARAHAMRAELGRVEPGRGGAAFQDQGARPAA